MKTPVASCCSVVIDCYRRRRYAVRLAISGIVNDNRVNWFVGKLRNDTPSIALHAFSIVPREPFTRVQRVSHLRLPVSVGRNHCRLAIVLMRDPPVLFARVVNLSQRRRTRARRCDCKVH